MPQQSIEDFNSRPYGVALVHTRGYQEIRDLKEIALRIRNSHPDIDAYVVDNLVPEPEDYQRVAARPTLVFSPVALANFTPDAGKIFQGKAISKDDQHRILHLHNVPTPKTDLLRLRPYDPADWSEWVVLKPLSHKQQSKGSLYRIRLTSLNRGIATGAPYLAAMIKHPHMIQDWIDTGPKLAYMRVLTLFGEALYASYFELAEDFDAERDALWNSEFVRVTSRGPDPKRREYMLPEEVADLCRRTYRAFPERALLGMDILYDVRRKQHYVLEINAGGNTWHFSSDHIKKTQKSGKKFRQTRKEKIRQFNAFQRAADLIAQKVRALPDGAAKQSTAHENAPEPERT